MKPNDSQVHFHFGNCTSAKVVNVQSLGWKGKQARNWAPQDTIRKVLKLRLLNFPQIFHLDPICMSYDQKKRRESNSQPSITNPLNAGAK